MYSFLTLVNQSRVEILVVFVYVLIVWCFMVCSLKHS